MEFSGCSKRYPTLKNVLVFASRSLHGNNTNYSPETTFQTAFRKPASDRLGQRIYCEKHLSITRARPSPRN